MTEHACRVTIDLMTENPYIDLIAQGIEERGVVRTGFSGRSMLPTLSDGMTLSIEKCDPRNVKTADIIFYKKLDQMVVHRVIGILREDARIIFSTKGDNHAYIECDHVPEENLLGVVRGAYHESEPQVNVLVDNRLIGMAYVLMGSSVSSIMGFRKYIPPQVRNVLKSLVGGFFFVFKKSIHTLYIGIRNGQLLFRRRGARSVDA